jgi:D-ribose pyranase
VEPRGARGVAAAESWEHLVEDAPTAERLAALGAEGWALVAVEGGRAFLRRPAPGYRARVTLVQRERALAALPGAGARAPGRVPPARQRLLHPEVFRIFAAAGHTDLVTVCDRGFPVPLGPERCDLALADDLPTVTDVLRLTASLFPPDRLVVAEEARLACPARLAELQALLPQAALDFVPHLELKALAAGARATVRTGDSVPYANVLWVG